MMRQAPFAIVCLLLGVLIGLEAGTFLGATAVFSGVDDGFFDSTVAGTIAGRLFQPVNIIGLFLLPFVSLLLSIWLRAGLMSPMGWAGFVLLQVSLLLILLELSLISPGISSLRESLGAEFGSVGEAPADHPDRQRFGMLHGLSMTRGVVQLASTTVAWILIFLSLKRPSGK